MNQGYLWTRMQTESKKILQQRKFKQYINLKYMSENVTRPKPPKELES